MFAGLVKLVLECLFDRNSKHPGNAVSQEQRWGVLVGFKSKVKEGRYNLRKPWEQIQTKAEIPDVHIHYIRRTFGLLAARKAGLHLASKLFRHSSIIVTERVYAPLGITERVYAPLGIDELREAMEKVSQEQGKVLKMPVKKSGAKR